MKTLIGDFSISLFLWQLLICSILIAFCYIVFKMIVKILRKKT